MMLKETKHCSPAVALGAKALAVWAV